MIGGGYRQEIINRLILSDDILKLLKIKQSDKKKYFREVTQKLEVLNDDKLIELLHKK